MSPSIRLDEKTESLLDQTAFVLQTTKTEIIRRSLLEYCSRILRKKQKPPYELIRDLLESEGSGRGDLSEKGEEILRKRFRSKG
jgi:hypothetical protein